MIRIENLVSKYDPVSGEIQGARAVERRLSNLESCFEDRRAYDVALAAGDPVIYSVAAIAPADGQGDLHCGLGRILPGKIGKEYYMTKGHLHAWREAAEFYFGLAGEGMLLLENQLTGESRIVPLRRQEAVYVPGFTAHRTINIGGQPLTYLGVYPAKAGHDYQTIAERNFRCLVVERDGKPALVDRANFIK